MLQAVTNYVRSSDTNIAYQVLGHTDLEITLKKDNRFIPDLIRKDGSAFERVMAG